MSIAVHLHMYHSISSKNNFYFSLFIDSSLSLPVESIVCSLRVRATESNVSGNCACMHRSPFEPSLLSLVTVYKVSLNPLENFWTPEQSIDQVLKNIKYLFFNVFHCFWFSCIKNKIRSRGEVWGLEKSSSSQVSVMTDDLICNYQLNHSTDELEIRLYFIAK